MNTSYSWMKRYVPDLDCTAQEYMDAMTLSGTKVEGYEKLDEDLDKIVVGQVVKIEKHPDADKLVVCQVNIGSEDVYKRQFLNRSLRKTAHLQQKTHLQQNNIIFYAV